MYSTILVPLDGSLRAMRALPFAARLARSGEARLMLVRAYQPNPDNLSLRLHYPAQTATQRANLDRGVALAELVATTDKLRRADLKVEARFVEAPAARAILDTAISAQPDLIVMSTHGHTGLGRYVYGSVADEVLRHVEVPVLVVSPRASRAWPQQQAGPVVVPFDRSAVSQTVFQAAAQLATALDAELVLVLVCAVEPPVVINPDCDSMIPPNPDQDLTQTQRDVELVAQELRLKTRQPITVRVAYGDAAAGINQTADESHAAAIAMATRGHSGLARLVMGSVATRTLEQARTPVLLYHPSTIPQYEQQSSDALANSAAASA